MIDLACIVFTTLIMVLVVFRAVQLDRDLPWFEPFSVEGREARLACSARGWRAKTDQASAHSTKGEPLRIRSWKSGDVSASRAEVLSNAAAAPAKTRNWRQSAVKDAAKRPWKR